MPDYRRRASREAMSVRLDVNGALAEAIGQAGAARDDVDGLATQAAEVARAVKAQRAAGALPFFDLPYQKETLSEIKSLANAVREECDTLVVLGIGGSALGTKTLISALETTRRVIVADNVDPMSFGSLLDSFDLARTTFNVISKSGETAETLAQFLIVRDVLLRKLGAVDYVKRVVITTDAEHGALRQVVNDEGFRGLVVPAGVGGRFAVLTAVGLFPAAVAGIRTDDLLAGAAWMDARGQDPAVWHNAAHLLASLLYLADSRRRQNVVVMMAYSDRLQWFAAWFVQLWAESLGKAETVDGAPAHVGQTPLSAVGVTDQHSLLQLLADGPADKVVIMLRVEDHGREVPVPAAYGDLDGIGYLGGVGLGQLLNLEQRATELALVKRCRPVITITVPQIDAFTLGQLFYLFEVAALFTGGLYRINPLDQPGVEDSKRLTYGQLGRKGFEAQRAEIEQWLARKRSDAIL
jgi:glucose-6-phosphate isomerase